MNIYIYIWGYLLLLFTSFFIFILGITGPFHELLANYYTEFGYFSANQGGMFQGLFWVYFQCMCRPVSSLLFGRVGDHEVLGEGLYGLHPPHLLLKQGQLHHVEVLQSINQSINCLINQPINQLINQPFNQSINQSI